MINVCNTKSAHLTIICLANVFAASVQIRLKYLLTYTLTVKINNFYEFFTLWQLWSLISPSFQETQLFPNILNYF